MKTKRTIRWHCYDIQGNKVTTTCIHGQPEPWPGYTEWRPGLGPMPPEVRARIGAKISARVKGVPKSAAQKEKMRLAKLGVPKSEEHKRNMSISQLRRAERMRLEKEAAYARTSS